ncbi:putative secondary metabolism biosynthetic enzyme [Bacidia gigantensis]|uniref:putative secondary metabolism biosynthetic enzyme n=1 Tax=Bacidia gigantensis TaxID=2732470 RepID=UPI001D05B1D5|nr:putative secondary metabolism biosynthetic enzyme [Bacidia gigantensis]KAG8528458.1 putative secondary metabolism biosynthetic enzyme [Bacidia gigantensis]
MKYPGILGSSFAGTVIEVGPDVKDFAPGDKVACNRPDYGFEDSRYGAYQRYAVASVRETSKLETNTSIEDGAAVILNLAAAVAAMTIHLRLDRPPLKGQAPWKGKKVLVYGGSSSCGGYAVRYAVDAGYDVVTTSSPKNRGFVQTLGPIAVLNHTESSDTIVSALEANGPYDAIFDSIGLPSVTNVFLDYFGDKGGEYVTLLPPLGGEKPIPSNVNRRFGSYIQALVEEANEELGQWFYEQYVPQALDSGRIIPTRQIRVEGGLGKVQECINRMGPGGISGHKLIMPL